MLTCAACSSQLQSFDGTDYRYRPEQIFNGMKAHAVYQFGPEPTTPEQKCVWHLLAMALVATTKDGPPSPG